MNKKNLDQALAALSDALMSQQDAVVVDASDIIKQIPKRSLSGDLILGGKIAQFKSSGITDQASKEQMIVTDAGVAIPKISGDVAVSGVLRVDTLEVKDLKTEIKFEKDVSVSFGGESSYGKGLLWTGQGYTKQFVFNGNPDRFFSSETIDIGKGKNLSINSNPVLSETELGLSVVKSSLREVGRLKGLIVDGNVSINQYMYYNASVDRLGLGTDAPNAALSIAEMGTEVMLGTTEELHGMVGTFASTDFDIVTDDTPRITVRANGNIDLGNSNKPPVQVTVNGKLSIGVKNPDPNVSLHVAGPVRLNNHIQMFAEAPPTEGNFTVGDIVWNANPTVGRCVGWVCLRAGSPGVWNPFGKIEAQG